MILLSNARRDEIEQYISTVETERDELKARLAAQDTELYMARLELSEAKAPQPASLTDVAAQLRAFVPTLPQSPGYQNLTTATDAKSFAQAIHLLLLHARSIGHREGARA